MVEMPAGVGRTALRVAWVRAEESRRPDRLFDDPHAAGFLAAVPGVFAEASTRGPGASLDALFSLHVVVRTRFFDDYLLSACSAGCRQVVLLAAGTDTRAFRLSWPDGIRLFEVDLPEVLAFKEKVLTEQTASARCARTAVAADLREDWGARLTGAGFDPDEPTAWLAEGLLIYLYADEAAALLTRVGELSAPGSRLSVTRGTNTALIDRARSTPGVESVTSLGKGGLGEDAATWLAERGWQVQTYDTASLADAYGRPAPEHAQSGFVVAVSRPG
jgi:methyltransferase (TIGR00027 family)